MSNIIEGTVTISLKDYEVLREEEKRREHYFNLAVRQIRLLEEAEVELTPKKSTMRLRQDINRALEEWYG